MTQYDEHEDYLKRMLANSLGSENPSDEAKQHARKLSGSFFRDYEEQLLNQYNGMKFKDIPNSKVISTDSGETLKITEKEKISFPSRPVSRKPLETIGRSAPFDA